MPIWAEDLDGLEPIFKTKVKGSTEATLNNIDQDYVLGYLIINWKASARNFIGNLYTQLKAGPYAPIIVRDIISFSFVSYSNSNCLLLSLSPACETCCCRL